MFTLSAAEPRLRRRYRQLVMAQLSTADRLAAGVHSPPGVLAEGFATTQAAWRFYRNPGLSLPVLCGPLVNRAVVAAAGECVDRTLVVLDWCNLHLRGHRFRTDRVELSGEFDLGYETLTALALSDAGGSPLAPVCVELRAGDGLHTTRSDRVLKASSVLDGLGPVMGHVAGLGLPKPPVFVIDKEADSVGHYREWAKAGREFLVRADDNRTVTRNGVEMRLDKAAAGLKFERSRRVLFKGKSATQFVAQTTVVLTRPAHRNRVDAGGRRRRKQVVGPALSLRLVAAQVRDDRGKVLATWLLLTNVPESVASAERIALWYYWRWKIETYHKLLKSAGQQVEQWRQETAAAFTRRLLVTAMAAVVVWELARDNRPEVQPLKALLVRLSGRQTDRHRNPRRFTEPMLLAGLTILAPMLALLETTTVEQLRIDAGPVYDLIRAAREPKTG